MTGREGDSMAKARNNREIHLVSRPTGWPSLDNFALVETTIGEPGPGEALVRIAQMSVDPYMRGRMSEARSYVPPFKVGQVMSGAAVGVVVESNDASLSPGDWVYSNELAWRDYGIASAKHLQKVDTKLAPPSAYLGVLGIPGLTAFVGLFDIGKLVSGETIFISSAGGAVGTIAGQLAKLHGAKVIGSVGTPEKAAYLTSELGFDAAFDYHDDIVKSLRAAAPDGIDVYFDNVGGEQLQAALGALKDFGRIVACGMIAQYNEAVPGPVNLPNIVRKRIRMEGFIVIDHIHRTPAAIAEILPALRDGRIKYPETFVEGLEYAPQALLDLFAGRGHTMGKVIVRVAPDDVSA